MNNRKSVHSIFIVCVFCLLMGGCQFKDVDRRMFVLSLGIDTVQQDESKEPKTEITLKLAIPQGDPTKGGHKALLVTQVADSIPEAVLMMKSKVDRELDFSHCKTILLGEQYARGDITELKDWMSRRRDIQLVALVATAQPSAKDVLTTEPESEQLPTSTFYQSLSKAGTESPFILKMFSFEFRRKLTELGIDPILPVVEKDGKDKLIINKSILMDKKKMRAELSPEETRLFNLLNTRNLRSSYTVQYEGNLYSYDLETTRAKYRLIPTKDGKVTVQYNVRARANLENNNGGTVVTEQILREVSREASKQWEKKLMAFLKKIHGTELDPLGWGLRYRSRHWNNAEELKQWEELYPDLEFAVHANVQIKYTGIIR